jgi:hypothetical protein
MTLETEAKALETEMLAASQSGDGGRIAVVAQRLRANEKEIETLFEKLSCLSEDYEARLKDFAPSPHPA